MQPRMNGPFHIDRSECRAMKATTLVAAVLISAINLPTNAVAKGLWCFGKPATIVGTDGRDTLTGTPNDDVIVGLGGKDFIFGYGGDDRICSGGGGTRRQPEHIESGAGDDMVRGGAGSQAVYASAGDDLIRVGPGYDPALMGGKGNDQIWGGRGTDWFYGKEGADRLYGGRGSDSFHEGPGDDIIVGGPDTGRGDAVSYLDSQQGLEVDLQLRTATSGLGRDSLSGVEVVIGTMYDDTIRGNDRANLFFTFDGDDVLIGLGGDDCLSPYDGENTVEGGSGDDAYAGNAFSTGGCLLEDYSSFNPIVTGGVDVDLTQGRVVYHTGAVTALTSIESAYGTLHDDTLVGDDGRNRLFGGGLPDRIEGRGGDDLLDGGAGDDFIDGGDGEDTCLDAEASVRCE